MAERALHLGMSRLSHDDWLVAIFGQTFDGTVHLLHKGARGVKHRRTALTRGSLNRRRHAVRAQKQRGTSAHGRVIHYRDTLSLKL